MLSKRTKHYHWCILCLRTCW